MHRARDARRKENRNMGKSWVKKILFGKEKGRIKAQQSNFFYSIQMNLTVNKQIEINYCNEAPPQTKYRYKTTRTQHILFIWVAAV